MSTSSLGGLCLLFFTARAPAQDLDPRAYARIPVDVTFVVAGFSYSNGGIVTDATTPLLNAHVDVETPSIADGQTFSLFGQTAQAFAALPYSWAQGSAEIGGQTQNITRSGFSDMRLRFSILFLDAPATKGEELRKFRVGPSWAKA
jgi:hypothetical protein